MDETGYDSNVGKFKADHPEYVLQAGFEGFGFTAQRKNANGHGVGSRYSDLTLDGLDGQLRAAEATQLPEKA